MAIKADFPKLIVARYDPERDDYIVKCPTCNFEGHLMADFSLLAAGFGGVEAGGPEDLNVQECGRCTAKLNWDDVPLGPPEVDENAHAGTN